MTFRAAWAIPPAAIALVIAAPAGAAPVAGMHLGIPTPVASVVAGTKISTSVTLTNIRSTKSGLGTLRFYLSTDGQPGRGVRLATRDTAALKAHARKRFTLSGTVPAGLPAAQYRVLVSLDARSTAFKPGAPSRRGDATEIAPDATDVSTAPAPTVVEPAAPAPPAAPPVAPPVTPPAPVNHAPTAGAVAVTTDEGTPAAIHLTGADADGDALTYATTQPAHGTLSGTAPNLTYTPLDGYVGSDAFTYTASDASSTSGAATVSITVARVDQAPVAADDLYDGAFEEQPYSVAAPGVLANDSDPDGDALTAAVVTQPAHGSVTLSPDGSFVYLPAVNFFGVDTFTYRANDGTLDSNTGTVTVYTAPD